MGFFFGLFLNVLSFLLPKKAKKNTKFENGRIHGIILSCTIIVFLGVTRLSYNSYVRHKEMIAAQHHKKKFRIFTYSAFVKNGFKQFLGFSNTKKINKQNKSNEKRRLYRKKHNIEV